MKIRFIILCLALFCWSCIGQKDLTRHDLQCTERNYYTIDQIKREQNIYIIYASKDDKPYKILSRRRFSIFRPDQEKIHCGGRYCLHLDSLLPREIMGFKIMPPGGGGATGIEYYGVDVSIEAEKNIGDLFEANNLKGLFIKKKYCKP